MLEAEKEYECQNPRCRCRFKVKADIEQGGIMEVPVPLDSIVCCFRLAVHRTRTRVNANLCNSNRSKCVFSIDFHSGQRRVLRLRRNSRAGANPDAGSGHNASFHHDHSVKRSR